MKMKVNQILRCAWLLARAWWSYTTRKRCSVCHINKPLTEEQDSFVKMFGYCTVVDCTLLRIELIGQHSSVLTSSLIHQLMPTFSRSVGASSSLIKKSDRPLIISHPDLPPIEAWPWEPWARDYTTYWMAVLFYSKMRELVINSWIRFNQSLPEYHTWRVQEITTLRSKSHHLLLYLKTVVSRPRQHQQVEFTWFEAHHIWILRNVGQKKKQNLRDCLFICIGDEMISSAILKN